MKSLVKVGILVLCFSFLASVVAEAQQRGRRGGRRAAAPKADMTYHRMAGCGLGSMLIEDNSKWPQVGASLLNGTGFQSIAISFGTSNCTEDGAVQASREKEAF